MNSFMNDVFEVVGWAALFGLLFFAFVYCTPPQKTAEADAFDASCEEAGV